MKIRSVNEVIEDSYALTYDDISLYPQYSELESRSQANTQTKVGQFNLRIPILSANMATVTEFDMGITIANMGGLGVLHRYMPFLKILKIINEFYNLGKPIVPSIGVNGSDVDSALEYVLAGAKMVCVDIAHGDSLKMVETLKSLINLKIPVIAGNVCTYEGAKRLFDLGVQVVKVGVGPGANCTTRRVTGHGVPQLSAVQEATRAKKHFNDVQIIADGGIRDSGDIVKALAFGADAVMIGSLLAGTDESPGEVFEINGKKVKKHSGMASADAQTAWLGKVNNNAPEGVSANIPYKGPVSNIVEQLVGGIRSGLSYSGSFDIKELQSKAKYVMVTHAGLIEGHPHILNRG